jgi:hypothetical protein
MMKKLGLIVLALTMILSLVGCGEKTEEGAPVESKQPESTNAETVVDQEPSEEAGQKTVQSLPDTTMENLSDAILSVSLEEGGAYVDDTGKMQMDVKVFTYDRYDMVDISMLKVGDTMVTHAGEVEVTAMECSDSGILRINGGLEEGGFDLVTDECGVFYEVGFDDAKNWYEVGEATIRVSADFKGYDNSDPEQGEVIIYPGDFLVDGVADYNFTPYNTTIRVEGGQIVEMNRVYTP